MKKLILHFIIKIISNHTQSIMNTILEQHGVCNDVCGIITRFIGKSASIDNLFLFIMDHIDFDQYDNTFTIHEFSLIFTINKMDVSARFEFKQCEYEYNYVKIESRIEDTYHFVIIVNLINRSIGCKFHKNNKIKSINPKSTNIITFDTDYVLNHKQHVKSEKLYKQTHGNGDMFLEMLCNFYPD
jgi:hypothetical protein